MNLKLFIILLYIAGLFLGCSSPSKLTNDSIIEYYNNTSDSKSNNIKFIIPNGWRVIKDNVNKLFEIWLINKNNNAVICFIPVNLSDSINISSKSARLKIIRNITNSKRKGSGRNFHLISEKVLNENYLMNFSRYSIDNHQQNSIIFGNNNYYYESLAYFDKKFKPSDSEIDELFQLQKNVIQGIEFK